ncbi:MAG: hypothetical protein RLZZ118_1171 [Bacteroidota bacterium]|jgi:hypothetical protein
MNTTQIVKIKKWHGQLHQKQLTTLSYLFKAICCSTFTPMPISGYYAFGNYEYLANRSFGGNFKLLKASIEYSSKLKNSKPILR